MDASYFLKRRTAFIRYFYDEGLRPFREVQRKIKDGELPFDDPPYSEDPEPAFLDEWIDAQTGAEVHGHSCVALLSDTLKLYFNTLQHTVIGFSFEPDEGKIFKKLGFVSAYKVALGEILGTDWSDCPVRFDIIEQVVLARNRGQHGGDLTTFSVRHDGKTLSKHPRPFFASEMEIKTWDETDQGSFLMPQVEVTRENLFAAIEQAETLADWIEARNLRVWEWRRGQRANQKD